SAEFGLARALQRAGKADEAHQHLKIFQHYTQTKISAPLSVGYGERGHYSSMEDMAAPPQPAAPMIPVRFEEQRVMRFVPSRYESGAGRQRAAGAELGGGACILDIEGAGSKDLVVMGHGPQAIE